MSWSHYVCICSNKYGKRPEDLTDDVEMKQALQLCDKVDSHPQIWKSPHVSIQQITWLQKARVQY